MFQYILNFQVQPEQHNQVLREYLKSIANNELLRWIWKIKEAQTLTFDELYIKALDKGVESDPHIKFFVSVENPHDFSTLYKEIRRQQDKYPFITDVDCERG